MFETFRTLSKILNQKLYSEWKHPNFWKELKINIWRFWKVSFGKVVKEVLKNFVLCVFEVDFVVVFHLYNSYERKLFLVRKKTVLSEKNSIINVWRGVNPLTTSAPHHIETSQLICRAKQFTGFYVMGNIGH